MDSPYSRELTIAFSALQNAARLSQSIISAQDKGAIEKADLSPVTVADFAVQALLIATFQDAFPGDRFVGEEDASGLRDNEALLERVWELLQRVGGDGATALPATRELMCDLIDEAGASSPGGDGSGRTWVFDPIDGTKTYVRGELYAINIGLLVDGKQTLGAVGCPNMPMDAAAPLCNADIDPSGEGCIVYAVKGHGAFIRKLRGSADDAPPRRLPRQQAPDALRFVTCVGIVDSALAGVHEAVAARL
ncbi:3'(2'),5'-bisphosphate nucleotidase, partial [Tolypocladium paradoxum]